MATIDSLIVVIFLALMIGGGSYFYKWIKNPDDFYVAGRKLTPFILAAVITATNINLYSFIGQSGVAYSSGISIIWNTWTGNMALVLSGLFIVPILRRMKIRTIPELIEIRYTRGLRKLVGIIWMIRLTFWLGIGMYAITLLAQTITGIHNFVFWVFVLTVIMVLYTSLGGAWSVAFADVLQFFLMLGAMLILLPIAMHAVGGWSALAEKLHGKRLTFVTQSVPYDWKFLLTMLLLGIKWASIDQGVLQRAFGSSDTKSAVKGMVYAGIITTPFAFLWIMPGLAAADLYPHLANFDNAVPTLIVHYIPPVLLGIVVCGFLSAQMSTIGPELNSIATLFANDVYATVSKKEATPKKLLFIARFATVMAGLFMIGFAFLVPMLGGVVSANLTVVAITDMPLFVVTIVYGLFWKRANWQGAVGGYFIGVATGLLVWLIFGRDFNLAAFSSAGAALIASPLISLLTKKPQQEKFKLVFSARYANHDGQEETDNYHIIPVSFKGKISLVILGIGLVIYVLGAILGAYGYSIASATAIIGMVLFFIGGGLRVFFIK